MSPEPEQMPLWAKQFQGELLRGLGDVQKALRDMVSRDTFRDEKERVNSEIKDLHEEIRDARRETQEVSKLLRAESSARQNAELAAAQKATDEAQERQKVQKATNWQWLLIIVVPVVNWIFEWLRNGVAQ